MAAVCGGLCGRRVKVSDEWFQAASTGNVELILKLLPKHSKAPLDTRPTLSHATIFCGFAAIHYAAYNGHKEAVKLLLPTEASTLTGKAARIQALGILNSRLYIQLDAGATALMVAIIRGHISIAHMLIDFVLGYGLPYLTRTVKLTTGRKGIQSIQGVKKERSSKVKSMTLKGLPPVAPAKHIILGVQTDSKVSALILAVSLNSSASLRLLKANNYVLLREELELTTKDDGNIALMIGLLGRDTVLECIISLIFGPDECYTEMNALSANTNIQLLIKGSRVVGPLPPFQTNKNLFVLAIRFMKVTMRRDSRGFSVLDSARYKLDEKKYGVSRTAKERTYLLFHSFLWRVCVFGNDAPPVNLQNPCEHWDSYETCCSRLDVPVDEEFKDMARGLLENPEVNHILDDLVTQNALRKLMRPFSSSLRMAQADLPVEKALHLEDNATEAEAEIKVETHAQMQTRVQPNSGVSGHQDTQEPMPGEADEKKGICYFFDVQDSDIEDRNIHGSIFNSNIEPSSTLNSTLMLTKTIVGHPRADDQMEREEDISSPPIVSKGIDLAQLTPLAHSNRSSLTSVRMSDRSMDRLTNKSSNRSSIRLSTVRSLDLLNTEPSKNGDITLSPHVLISCS